MIGKDMLVFDLETTSAEPTEARIVTAYAGLLDADGKIIDEVDLLVRPDGFTIPDEAIAIHGVTNEHATENGIALDDALSELLQFFYGYSGLPLAGQNIAYDFTVLDRELRRARGDAAGDRFDTWLEGRNVLDSIVLDKAVDKWRKGSRNLLSLATHYGVELSAEEAHGARSDAIAAGRIIQILLDRPALSRMSLGRLHTAQKRWRREQCASLQNYLRTLADPPQPDAVVDGAWPLRPYVAEVPEEVPA